MSKSNDFLSALRVFADELGPIEAVAFPDEISRLRREFRELRQEAYETAFRFSSTQPKQESKMTKETHEKLATEVALMWAEASKNLIGVPKNPAAFGAMAAHAYLGAMAVLEKNACEEAATASSTPAQALFETLRLRVQSPESRPSSSKEPAPICPADTGVSA